MSNDVCAVVLSCRGGDQGTLGLVRSLGRAGHRVVLLTENPTDHALASRFTTEAVRVGSFKEQPEEVLAALLSIADREAERPVLFPSSDPDLELISRHREALERRFRFTSPRPELVEICLDKGRFFEFANAKGFPIAKTIVPKGADDLDGVVDELRFPLILKPLHPSSWMKREIRRIVERKKAVLVEDEAELRDLYGRIAEFDSDLVVQEYIPGRDDALVSVHVYMAPSGQALASFVGRKIRTYPAFAGIGCSVVSEPNADLVDTSVWILQQSRYTGIALLQYKQHETTGEYVLLEINARASSWNHFATECGVDIPSMAFDVAVERTVEPVTSQVDRATYVYLKPDLLALREYLRSGDWTVIGWLRSFRGPRVHQLFSFQDPGPVLTAGRRDAGSIVRKILRTITRR